MKHLRFNTEVIGLPDGWSGRVLTRRPGEVPEYRIRSDLPTIKEWGPLLSQLTSDPAALPGYAVLKYSEHGEVFRAGLTVGDGVLDIICKQGRARGFSGRLVNTLRASRENRNCDRALMLLEAGIRTALPLAVVERRRPRCEARLVTEFVPGLVDLDEVVLRLLPRLERRPRRKAKDAIVKAIVDLLEQMTQDGLAHRDLKASNILLDHWDGAGGPANVWLVDLDGLRRRKFAYGVRRWDSVMRLAASLLGYTAVTRSDYCRFLQAYLARMGSPPTDWKRHFRKLSRQASAYTQRAGRRKTHKLDGYPGD